MKKIYKLTMKFSSFALAFLIPMFTTQAQATWTQTNTTSRGTQFYNSSGALGYSVRTSLGGGRAWQFVDDNNIPYFQVQFPTGNAGFGLNNASWFPQTGSFEFRNGAALGSSNGSRVLLTSTSTANATNYFQNNVWARRVGTGTDWMTTRLHDAISIDFSYLAPGSDTRTWWERAPLQDFQLWGTGNQTYMALMGSNLWIGPVTQNTQYKLAVAGKIAAWGEIKVFTDGSSFPDYVFAPEYKLRSLEETEKYVKENHHLPEVPSAAEIAKDGMSLNGMNEILLKKVEEITLYLIEMKKENETLKKRLEVLEKNK